MFNVNMKVLFIHAVNVIIVLDTKITLTDILNISMINNLLKI